MARRSSPELWGAVCKHQFASLGCSLVPSKESAGMIIAKMASVVGGGIIAMMSEIEI